MNKITNYAEFVSSLLEAGFSMGGGNSENIFAVIPWGWQENAPYTTPVRWHTGDPETDPWEWRMRVLDERDDIAYAKVFFRKSGYITREWYPYFLAARRGDKSFPDAYREGTMSLYAKRIYDTVSEHRVLPLHAIKQLGGFKREDTSQFDRAIVELQMQMFLTLCGRQQKISKSGEKYGWSSTVFCRAEDFFEEAVFKKASRISRSEATEKITEQVFRLNPAADIKKIRKFITG